jgi:Flp pilus assembly protein TadD
MASPARVRLALLAVGVVGLAVAWYAWHRSTLSDPPPNPDATEEAGPPADPRVTFDTPFRNVRPGVAYVGDAACAPCHKDLCDAYHEHPMGRSAALWADARRVEQFGPAAQTTFTGPTGARYRADERNGRLALSEDRLDRNGKVAADTTVDAAVVIGSGKQARSYLCLRDGSLWQAGIAWYTGRQRWDLSPGFPPGHHAQRPVTEACLACHVNRVERVGGTESRYREPLFARQVAIGCERCHGPGSLHVEERTAGAAHPPPDTSIVNPRHLPADLREAVCQQCHLAGTHRVARRGRGPFDFRPGLPLELVMAVFVNVGPRGPEFTGHVEQMAASRCAAGSGGRLGCTSCHDPHRDPPAAARAEHFRKACLACHADRGCSLPVADRQPRNDACASCHMPRGPAADISHTAVTDHRIVRRPNQPPASGPLGTDLPIRMFHDGSQFAPPADERDRDLGIALVQRYRADRAAGRSDLIVVQGALERLTRATRRFPTDAAAWEALAVIRAADRDAPGAMAAAEQALAIEPDREQSLHQAIMTAVQLNDFEKAASYARRAVEVNPGNALSRIMLGLALTERRDWSAARDALRDGLRDAPGHTGGLAALAVCLFRLGDRAGAQVELDRIAALAPNEAAYWQNWFRRRAG